MATNVHPDSTGEVKFIRIRVLTRAQVVPWLPEWHQSPVFPIQTFLHRSTKALSGIMRQEPYLSFLSCSPGDHEMPIQHSIFKTENPNQIHQTKCSLSYPGPKSMAEWTLRRRSLGGRGVSKPLPPHCRFQRPSQGSVTSLHSADLLSSEASDGQTPSISCSGRESHPPWGLVRLSSAGTHEKKQALKLAWPKPLISVLTCRTFKH